MRTHAAPALSLFGVSLLVLSVTGCGTTGPSPDRPTITSEATPTTQSFGDRGPQRYAEGVARREGPEAFLYTVAAGDTAVGVAARFGTTVDTVSASSRGGQELFAGDELHVVPSSGAATQ